jgi:hypothetical protein
LIFVLSSSVMVLIVFQGLGNYLKVGVFIC